MFEVDLEAAWDELHEANAALGWFVGRPAFEPRRAVPWSMFCADLRRGTGRPEWTFTAMTEVECVREMARFLRDFREGRVPQ
jgi:hypothetical protein